MRNVHGIAHFGMIFGMVASLFALGLGIGPILTGPISDHFGNYVPALAGAVPVLGQAL